MWIKLPAHNALVLLSQIMDGGERDGQPLIWPFPSLADVTHIIPIVQAEDYTEKTRSQIF